MLFEFLMGLMWFCGIAGCITVGFMVGFEYANYINDKYRSDK